MKKVVLAAVYILLTSCSEGPYSEGVHWDYLIFIENGYVYKILDNRRGTIQIHNSDGSPLREGKEIY